jgi:hypothetical protein
MRFSSFYRAAALAASLASATLSFGFNTYSWLGNTTEFDDPNNWSPARTSPASDDKLVITGIWTITLDGGNYTAGELQLIGAYVNFQPDADSVLTLTGTGALDSGEEAFLVNSASSCRILGSSTLAIVLSSLSYGKVQANLLFDVSGASQSRVVARQSGGLVFKSAAVCYVHRSNVTSDGCFGTNGDSTTASVDGGVHFESGSRYLCGSIDFSTPAVGSYADPFQLPAPASMVVFETGSTINFYHTNGLPQERRSFAKVEMYLPEDGTMAPPTSIDDLVLDQSLSGTTSTLTINGTADYTVPKISGIQCGFADIPSAPRVLTIGSFINAKEFTQGEGSVVAGPGFVSVSQWSCPSNVCTTSDLGTSFLSGKIIIRNPGGILGQFADATNKVWLLDYAEITYNGDSAQVTGLQLSHLPAGPLAKMVIDNAGNVTLDNNFAVNNLVLTSGRLITGANQLTIGSQDAQGSVSGSGLVEGNIRQWVPNDGTPSVAFPLESGGSARQATVTFSSAPSSTGTLTATFTAADPGTNGLPLSDGPLTLEKVGQEGYWTISAGDGLAGGTYDIALSADGFSNLTNPANVRVVKRSSTGDPWSLVGSAGLNTADTIIQTGLAGFSEFAIASDVNQLPVVFSGYSAE